MKVRYRQYCNGYGLAIKTSLNKSPVNTDALQFNKITIIFIVNVSIF
jgi:hypothetical protein